MTNDELLTLLNVLLAEYVAKQENYEWSTDDYHTQMSVRSYLRGCIAMLKYLIEVVEKNK